MLLDQQPRDAAGEIIELGVGLGAMVVDDRERLRIAALKQLRRRIQALGIMQFGEVEAELGQQLRGRQAVADEAVVGHSGTTAVASISTLASGSTRRTTSTSAIAG